MWSDYGTIIQRCTHEPHFCACFLLAKDRRKKKLSRLPVLRREAIAFEVCIREGEDETIVRNTSLQDLRSQHNSPPKSCSGCKSLDVFCPRGQNWSGLFGGHLLYRWIDPLLYVLCIFNRYQLLVVETEPVERDFSSNQERCLKPPPNLAVSCMLYPLDET